MAISYEFCTPNFVCFIEVKWKMELGTYGVMDGIKGGIKTRERKKTVNKIEKCKSRRWNKWKRVRHPRLRVQEIQGIFGFWPYAQKLASMLTDCKLKRQREKMRLWTYKWKKAWMEEFLASILVSSTSSKISSFVHPSFLDRMAIAVASNPVSACKRFHDPIIFWLVVGISIRTW